MFAASKGQGSMSSSSTRMIEKGKEQVKEEEYNHEEEREFELIHIDNDEENETRIANSLLQDRNAQIRDLEVELERAKDVIHILQMQNKKMSGQQAIYEARALKYQKEAQRAQVNLEEYMGSYE